LVKPQASLRFKRSIVQFPPDGVFVAECFGPLIANRSRIRSRIHFAGAAISVNMTVNLLNPIFIPLYFVGFWIVICFGISLIGGWHKMGRVYAAEQPFQGESWSFQDAGLRYFTSYHNVLKIGANPEGLSLAVFPLFRAGHPPLFIPWQDISVLPGMSLWVPIYKFEFRQVPDVPLRLREKLAMQIKGAAGAAWPEGRPANGKAF